MFTNRDYLRNRQYRDASNLNARGDLHERFSTNPYGWFPWVFDQLELPSVSQVLELGCGPGGLWWTNRERIPPGWTITLTDLSNGMVETARPRLQGTGATLRFAVDDAQALPFADSTFDGVLANHMLYHVPDRPRALSEIRRVLKPGGHFYAATNGLTHLREMNELREGCGISSVFGDTRPFSLENGPDQLRQWFDNVEVRRYPDALRVPEAEPLIAYVRTVAPDALTDEQLSCLRTEIERRLASTGTIHIAKDSGLIIARRQG